MKDRRLTRLGKDQMTKDLRTVGFYDCQGKGRSFTMYKVPVEDVDFIVAQVFKECRWADLWVLSLPSKHTKCTSTSVRVTFSCFCGKTIGVACERDSVRKLATANGFELRNHNGKWLSECSVCYSYSIGPWTPVKIEEV